MSNRLELAPLMGAGRPRFSIRPLVSGLSLLVIGGCATTGDPAEGGFITGISNLSDGTYERRIAERERSLNELRSTRRELQAALAAQRAEQEQVSTELRTEEERLARLDQDLDELSRTIAQARSQRRSNKNELARLESEVAALKARQSRLSSAQAQSTAQRSPAELASLEDEASALRAQVERAMLTGVGVSQ